MNWCVGLRFSERAGRVWNMRGRLRLGCLQTVTSIECKIGIISGLMLVAFKGKPADCKDTRSA